MIPVKDFTPETLQLIGALALEHSSADDSLTFYLTVLHSRDFVLGYPLFAELFFGRKVDLLREAVAHARSGSADAEGVPDSEYESLLKALSELKVLGQRRNDIMHGVVCLPELPGDTALLRRPNKKGKGEVLDNRSLAKLLADFRTVMGKVALGFVRIMSDQRRRERRAAAARSGSIVRSSTRLFRTKVGGKEVDVLRSRTQVERKTSSTSEIQARKRRETPEMLDEK